ncbi:hypothetical protein [Aureimonas altamirensis]|uniref:hypothetical protein n=1 Tax=Aureimonas altamirensis TaxID=370622 RepID=UPI000AE1D74F|nr:hypothetical protein [Aureimonas altamirensis]
MAQTSRSSAARRPQWRIIEAECWTVRRPAGPELRRPVPLKRGFAAAFREAVRRLGRFCRG